MPSGFDCGKREVKKHQVTPEGYDDTVDNSPHRSTEHVDAAHSHLQDSNDHKPRYLVIIECVCFSIFKKTAIMCPCFANWSSERLFSNSNVMWKSLAISQVSLTNNLLITTYGSE